MTHTHAALVAIVLTASSALAELEVFVSLTHDDADGVILVGDSVNWSLEIGFSGFDTGWVVGLGDLTITGDNLLGTASNINYEFFNGGSFQGLSNGAGVSEIRFGNAPFCIDPLCLGHNTDNPMLVGTFAFTADAEGTLNYNVAEGTATWGFVEMQLDIITKTAFSVGQTTITIDQLTIIPTPASIAPLAMGLLAFRRRR